MAHSTKSSESSLTFSVSASEKPMDEESKSTAESVSSDRSLSSDLNAPRTMLFLGARDCGKHELVQLLVEHLQQQNYGSPSFHKLIQDRAGDVYHFEEEGLRIVEIPGFDPRDFIKFKAKSVSDRFKTPFTRDVPRVDAIFLVLKAVDTKINVIASMRFFTEFLKAVFGRDSQQLMPNIFILLTRQIKDKESTRTSLDTIRKCGMRWRGCFAVNRSSAKSVASACEYMMSVLSHVDPLSTAVQKVAKPRLKLWTGSSSVSSLD